MPDAIALAIISESLALRTSHAHASAADVLDLVMQGAAVRRLLSTLATTCCHRRRLRCWWPRRHGDHTTAAEWETFTGPKADASLRATLQLQYALNVCLSSSSATASRSARCQPLSRSVAAHMARCIERHWDAMRIERGAQLERGGGVGRDLPCSEASSLAFTAAKPWSSSACTASGRRIAPT